MVRYKTATRPRYCGYVISLKRLKKNFVNCKLFARYTWKGFKKDCSSDFNYRLCSTKVCNMSSHASSMGIMQRDAAKAEFFADVESLARMMAYLEIHDLGSERETP